MGYVQMNLFDVVEQVQFQLEPVVVIPFKAAPKPISEPPKPYTITHSPSTGYRVVAAPGLTTATGKNPCLSCPDFGKDMETCSENCTARLQYLGYFSDDGISAVSGEGSYGFGC